MVATDLDQLSAGQQNAVNAFMLAMQQIGEAMEALEAAGLSPADALRSIPGESEGTTAFDSLPPAMRMMLG
jgi:hypothetical protein